MFQIFIVQSGVVISFVPNFKSHVSVGCMERGYCLCIQKEGDSIRVIPKRIKRRATNVSSLWFSSKDRRECVQNKDVERASRKVRVKVWWYLYVCTQYCDGEFDVAGQNICSGDMWRGRIGNSGVMSRCGRSSNDRC